MLTKLLKYEMKASARTLLPLYIGTLVVALLCGIQVAMIINSSANSIMMDMPFFDDGLIPMFTFLLFFALCVAIMVLTAMIIIQRFNKNLIGDEGYLMFTLPVTHVQLLSSKLIAGLLWVVLGTVVMGLAAVIIWAPGILIAATEMDWAYFWNEVMYLMSVYNPIPSMSLFTLDCVITVVGTILTVYVSIMIGQMEQFDKHRVAISVVVFFLIHWLISLLDTGILEVMGLGFFDDYVLDITFGTMFNTLVWMDIFLTIIQSAACFAGVIWLMKKKLNL